MLWARDLWHGFTPEYTADSRPRRTRWRPPSARSRCRSATAADGDHCGSRCCRSARSCSSTYRLGAELFSPWVGVVAALVVLTRPAIERDALIGYQDMPFAALVSARCCWRRGARGAASPCSLLALAGLLRPEAWVLAGLYWLYLWPATSPRSRRASSSRWRRAADLGRQRLAHHGRPAALAARHRRAGRGRRPPPPHRPGPVLDARSTSATRCASRWSSASRSASPSPGCTAPAPGAAAAGGRRWR